MRRGRLLDAPWFLTAAAVERLRAPALRFLNVVRRHPMMQTAPPLLALLINALVGLTAALRATPAQARTDDASEPPLRERAVIIYQSPEERLDLVTLRITREESVALWVLMTREYFEEPVIAIIRNARSMSARRRTIPILFDPGDGQPVKRLTVSCYGLAGLFEAAWDRDRDPDQGAAVADIIAARDRATIAINTSDLTAFGGGMTLSRYRAMTAAV
jgi:hypothetical protein